MEKIPVKIVIVGEVNAGKSCLWQSYFQNRRRLPYIQTVFDNYSTNISYNGEEMPINVFEACGDEDYAALRKLIYPGAHVIIFCVSIDSPDILSKGKALQAEKWSQELKEHCKRVPVIVVGTKKDLRMDPEFVAESKQKLLKFKDIVTIAKKFKNSTALECSSISKDGLHSVFQTAVKMGLRKKATSK